MSNKEDPNINLSKYQLYKKRRPKHLVRTIIYTIILIGVAYYGIEFLGLVLKENNKSAPHEIEVFVDDDTLNTNIQQ